MCVKGVAQFFKLLCNSSCAACHTADYIHFILQAKKEIKCFFPPRMNPFTCVQSFIITSHDTCTPSHLQLFTDGLLDYLVLDIRLYIACKCWNAGFTWRLMELSTEWTCLTPSSSHSICHPASKGWKTFFQQKLLLWEETERVNGVAHTRSCCVSVSRLLLSHQPDTARACHTATAKALQLLCYVSLFDSTDYATHNRPLYQCYTKWIILLINQTRRCFHATQTDDQTCGFLQPRPQHVTRPSLWREILQFIYLNLQLR